MEKREGRRKKGRKEGKIRIKSVVRIITFE